MNDTIEIARSVLGPALVGYSVLVFCLGFQIGWQSRDKRRAAK